MAAQLARTKTSYGCFGTIVIVEDWPNTGLSCDDAKPLWSYHNNCGFGGNRTVDVQHNVPSSVEFVDCPPRNLSLSCR